MKLIALCLIIILYFVTTGKTQTMVKWNGTTGIQIYCKGTSITVPLHTTFQYYYCVGILKKRIKINKKYYHPFILGKDSTQISSYIRVSNDTVYAYSAYLKKEDIFLILHKKNKPFIKNFSYKVPNPIDNGLVALAYIIQEDSSYNDTLNNSIKFIIQPDGIADRDALSSIIVNRDGIIGFEVSLATGEVINCSCSMPEKVP